MGDCGEWEACVVATLDGGNHALTRFGYSPMQLLFGRELHLPDCLLGQGVDVVANSMRPHGQDRFPLSHFIRVGCRAAWLEYPRDKVMRQAPDVWPHPWREFGCGDVVCVCGGEEKGAS